MNKRLFLTLLVILISIISLSQSDTEILKEVDVIGNPTRIDPITYSLLEMDSAKKTYQGNDPFFTISKYVPSVISQSDNGLPYGYSYLRIRGIDQTRINFTLNGIPINEMEDQGIYFSNMPSFLDNISLIRVSRGIGTSKYGITSIGGSVDMESNSSVKEDISGELGVGSYGFHKYSIGFTPYIKDNIKFSSRIGYLSSNGFRNHSGGDGFNYFGQFSHVGKKDSFKLWGFYGKSNNQLSWIPVSQVILGQDYRTNLNTNQENDKFRQSLVSLNWSSSRIKNTSLSSSVYYGKVKGIYTSYIDPVSLGRFGLNSDQVGVMVGSTYERNRIVFNLGSNINLYQRSHKLSLDSIPDNLFYDNMGRKKDFVAFSKVNYRIGDFYAFGDIQYRYVNFDYIDDYNSSVSYYWNFINPKIGLKRTKGKHESWISLGHTNREVTRSDLFNGNDNLYVLTGNLYSDSLYSNEVDINITPESVLDFESGHKFLLRNFDLSVNYYFMSFRNERIMIKVDDVTGLPVREIVDRSLRTGIEFEISYYVNKFSIKANGAHSYNEILSLNKASAFSPTFSMNNYVSYKANQIFTLGIYGNFVSSMYLDNTERESTPSYYITNAFVEANIWPMSINFVANNIFNQKYYLPGGIYNGVGQYYPGALFNYSLSIKLHIHE